MDKKPNKFLSFLKGLKKFFLRYKPFWIVCAIVLCFCAVDYANYKTYSLEVIKVFSDDNPDGDPKKLYFSTYDKDETIYFRVKVTSGGVPCANHTLVAVGQESGTIMYAREVSNVNGEATFQFAPVTVFTSVYSIDASVLFYDESTAWIVEFRLENLHHTTLYRRP